MSKHAATSNTTELEKVRAVQEQSRVLGEFLEWLAEQELCICKQHQHTEHCYPEGRTDFRIYDLEAGEFAVDCQPIEKRLAAFFDINLEKFLAQKETALRTELDRLRALHNAPTSKLGRALSPKYKPVVL